MKSRDKIYQIAIAVVVIIPHVLMMFAQEDLVLNWYNTDDAFYYFKIAQNIVEGNGITFDGIANTNGFHPLWMIVILPIFSLARFDLIIPLRMLIGLQSLVGAFAGIIVYRLSKRVISPSIAFIIAITWVLFPPLHSISNKGGTEGGLNAFIIPLLWLFYVKINRSGSLKKTSKRKIFGLGVLSSLTLLTRLDNVFLVFLLGAGLLIDYWRESRYNFRRIISTWKQWIFFSAAYYVPLVFSLGLYLLGNKFYFGSEMPISGKIKRWWSTLKHTVYGPAPDNFKDVFEEIFSTNRSRGPWSLIITRYLTFKDWVLATLGIEPGLELYPILSKVFLVVIVCVLILLIYKSRELVLKSTRVWKLWVLFCACIVHILYYKVTGQSAQKSWYWITENFFAILLLAIMIEILYKAISSIKFGRWIAEAAVIVLVIGLVIPYVELGKRAMEYDPPSSEHFYLYRARWMEENTEPGSIIGMTGSGSSGYFVQDRVIVNLDGLANSNEYFVHLQKSTADHYLDSIGLDYVFGNPDTILRSNPYAWNFPDRLVEWKYFVIDEKTLVLFRFE